MSGLRRSGSLSASSGPRGQYGADVLLADGALGIALTLFWVYSVLEVITTDESQMRNLPKITWLLVVILLVDIGAIAWWEIGAHV